MKMMLDFPESPTYREQVRPVMLRFGVLCPAAIGHLNPMSALASELKRRGHEVVFFCLPEAARMLTDAGMEHIVVGEKDFAEGSVKRFYEELGRLSGLAGVKRIVEMAASRK